MDNQRLIKTLCENILALQKRCDLTPEEMAARLNISVDALSMMEKGIMTEEVTVDTLVTIEEEFGVYVKNLFLPI